MAKITGKYEVLYIIDVNQGEEAPSRSQAYIVAE